MKKNMAIFIMVVFVAWGCSKDDEAKETAPPAKNQHKIAARTAADFSLTNLDGKAVALSDFKDQPVVIIFTTTWCPYCIKEIPNWKSLYARHKDDVGFMAVYVNENRQKVASFAAAKALDYPVLLDPDGQVARAYGVRGVPTQVVIDREGKLFKQASFALAADIDAVLKD